MICSPNKQPLAVSAFQPSVVGVEAPTRERGWRCGAPGGAVHTACSAHSQRHGASSGSMRAVLLLAAGRWHRGPRKPSFGKEIMSTVSLWAPWELSALCCWSGSGCGESKGREGFLREITWTCSVHVEPCVSMGEEGSSAFHVQMFNSLRSDLAHSVKQE